MVKTFKLVLCCIVVSIALFVGNISGDSVIGIVPFTSAGMLGDSTKSEIYIHLINRLQFEQLPGGIKPQIISDTSCKNCIALVTGIVDSSTDMSVLWFTISSKSQSEMDQKVIPVAGYSIDDIVDLCILKIRHYLERNYMVKVRVSSKPLDCELFLNGIKAGKTPSELILEKGVYNLTLEHDFCKPYHDTLTVSPGSNIDIDAALNFSGYQSRAFLYSTLFFTAATMAFWALESKYHDDYSQLGSKLSDEVYTDYFNRYQAAYYCRIGVLNAAILSGAVSGYLTFKNVRLKKKLFSESKNH